MSDRYLVDSDTASYESRFAALGLTFEPMVDTQANEAFGFRVAHVDGDKELEHWDYRFSGSQSGTDLLEQILRERGET